MLIVVTTDPDLAEALSTIYHGLTGSTDSRHVKGSPLYTVRGRTGGRLSIAALRAVTEAAVRLAKAEAITEIIEPATEPA